MCICIYMHIQIHTIQFLGHMIYLQLNCPSQDHILCFITGSLIKPDSSSPHLSERLPILPGFFTVPVFPPQPNSPGLVSNFSSHFKTSSLQFSSSIYQGQPQTLSLFLSFRHHPVFTRMPTLQLSLNMQLQAKLSHTTGTSSSNEQVPHGFRVTLRVVEVRWSLLATEGP